MWYNSFKRCSKWRIILKRTAFTLTEILISLGIIGVMMALSVSIIKPREIQYKYQVQQAQKTLSEAMREAVLRTEHTHHRFPKETINNVEPVMQLCRGMNETLNTTTLTANIATSGADFKAGSNKGGCTITTLNGMTFHIWGPNGFGRPVCRIHRASDGTLMPSAAFIAYADIDGNGRYYSLNKDEAEPTDAKLGNLPAFFLDEDYAARTVPPDWEFVSHIYGASSCNIETGAP